MNNKHVNMWILLCITECTYTNVKFRTVGLTSCNFICRESFSEKNYFDRIECDSK